MKLRLDAKHESLTSFLESNMSFSISSHPSTLSSDATTAPPAIRQLPSAQTGPDNTTEPNRMMSGASANWGCWSFLQKIYSSKSGGTRDEFGAQEFELDEFSENAARNRGRDSIESVSVGHSTMASVHVTDSEARPPHTTEYMVQPFRVDTTASPQEQMHQLTAQRAKLQNYIGILSKAQEDNISPFDAITPNRDLDVSLLEAFVPEIADWLNEKHPGLNLYCFNSSEAFARHIKAQCETGKQAGIERGIFYIKAHLDDGTLIRHAICTETMFTPTGAKIRAYDSTRKDKSERFFNRLCNDIFGDDNKQSKNIKLKAFALGTQTARVGCDVCAISVAVKSFKLPAAATRAAFNPEDWDHMSGPQLIADPSAVHNAPKFYTHAQSQKTIDGILQNHPALNTEIVHKKTGKTFSEFHYDSRVKRVVDDVETGERNVEKEFGDSINTKRIYFLRQLENDMEKRIGALVPALSGK